MIDDFLDSLSSTFTKLALLIIAAYMGWVLVQAGLILLGALP